MAGKQYGLILSNKNKISSSSLGSRVLNPLQTSDDELEKDEDNEDTALNWVEASLKKSAGNLGQQSLQKRLLREALQEDASVFQYDEVYDEMKSSEAAKLREKKDNKEKKAKYIGTILKHAEKRKLETERRRERKVQKERDAEGDEFADKESFVTSSYLKKLEEIKEAEEEERREKFLEEKLDVHKHKNFGVFYNHLFKQRLGDKTEIKIEADHTVPDKEETDQVKVPDRTRAKNYRSQKDVSESPDRNNTSRNYDKNEDQNRVSDSSSENDQINLSRDSRKNYHSHLRRRSNSCEKQSGTQDKCDNKKTRKGSHAQCGGDNVSSNESGNSSEKRSQYLQSSGNKEGRNSHERRRENSSAKSIDRKGLGDNLKSELRKERNQSRERSRVHSGERDSHKKRREKSGIEERTKEGPQDLGRSKEREKGKAKRSLSVNEDPETKKQRLNHAESTKGTNIKVEKGASTSNCKVDIKTMSVEARIERYKKLFAKRTVGAAFKDALKNYFIRKSERERLQE